MNRRSIKSDLARIDRMKDSEIDYSDIPRLDKAFLKKATMAWTPAKKQLTIRLDEDALDWHARLANDSWQGLPDAHQPHSARGDGESAGAEGASVKPATLPTRADKRLELGRRPGLEVIH